MPLQHLRDELFAIDLEIHLLHLKKQSLIRKILEAKNGTSPLYSPEVENKKRKKLLDHLKKEIENGFIYSCSLQLQQTTPNPCFGVDPNSTTLQWLKKYAPSTHAPLKYVFTTHPEEKKEFIMIWVSEQYQGLPFASCVACIVSTPSTFFRKKIQLYGKCPEDLKLIASFLETLAASVAIEPILFPSKKEI